MAVFGKLRDRLYEDRKVWPLLAMICCSMLGSGMVIPMLSVYAASFGVTATLVGMLVTIFGIGRLLANFPAGWLSQSIGRRPLLVAGPLIVAAGSLGAALTSDFIWLCFWRLVQGVGSGMYLTVSLAALADASTSQTRARIVGLYQLALQTGASLGTVFGGVIAQAFGLVAPFWAMLIIALATALMALLSFRENNPGLARSLSGALTTERRGMYSMPFLAISSVSGIVFFTRTACLFQVVPLMGQDTFGLSLSQVGLGIGATTVAMMATMPFSAGIIEALGGRMAVVWSMLAMAAGLAVIVIGQNPVWFWLCMLLYGLAGGLNAPATGAYSIGVLPRRQYGAGMGLQRTISDIGYVAGPVVVGLIDDVSGYGHAGGILANVALLIVATGVFYLVSGGERRAE